MKTDSIIFDLDGTLWDSIDGIAASWNEALAERFPDVPRRLSAEDVRAVLGKTIPEIGRAFFPGLAQPRIDEIMAYCCEAESEYLAVHGGRLYPGVERTLATLHEKFRLFIVSNCHASYVPCFYRAHGLGRFFTDYECYGRTQAPKSESIRLLCGRNGLRGPVYVGDTAGDARAAHSAGLPFVFAAYGFGETDEYDYRIERFEDLALLDLP